jgi:hypothetical protein
VGGGIDAGGVEDLGGGGGVELVEADGGGRSEGVGNQGEKEEEMAGHWDRNVVGGGGLTFGWGIWAM